MLTFAHTHVCLLAAFGHGSSIARPPYASSLEHGLQRSSPGAVHLCAGVGVLPCIKGCTTKV